MFEGLQCKPQFGINYFIYKLYLLILVPNFTFYMSTCKRTQHYTHMTSACLKNNVYGVSDNVITKSCVVFDEGSAIVDNLQYQMCVEQSLWLSQKQLYLPLALCINSSQIAVSSLFSFIYK